MTVSEAIDSRISVRAYTDEPVPRETVERILAAAGRSPSGGNLQPWQVYVLMDEALAAFKAGLAERQRGKPFGETPLFHVYPPKLHEPYRTRRFECGEDLYATLGIPREDKAGRMRQFAGNFDFFGAPVALFFAIDKRMDRNQWAHLGMFMQSVMLLAREAGLDTCCLLYTSPSPRDRTRSRMPSSA